MKLTNIALYSNDQEVAEFNFRDPASNNPYSVTAISGLDADVITPKYYATNVAGDQKFYFPVAGVREIAMRIVLDPRWERGEDVSSLRADLYRAISSRRSGAVQVRFRNGPTTIAVAEGFITKFDTDHFAPEPAVQLTVRCEDSMLRALNPTIVDVNALTDCFTVQDKNSTAPHGLRAKLTLTGAAASFVIKDVAAPGSPSWAFTVTPPGGFLSGDEVYISSINSDHYFYVVRSGNTLQMADSIEPGSVWPLVFPGTNDFVIEPDTFTWDEMEYYPTYWGV